MSILDAPVARIDGTPSTLGLVDTPDEKGKAGDVTWNFEKFLVDAQGSVVARFSPQVEPEDPQLVAAVQTLVA